MLEFAPFLGQRDAAAFGRGLKAGLEGPWNGAPFGKAKEKSEG